MYFLIWDRGNRVFKILCSDPYSLVPWSLTWISAATSYLSPNSRFHVLVLLPSSQSTFPKLPCLPTMANYSIATVVGTWSPLLDDHTVCLYLSPQSLLSPTHQPPLVPHPSHTVLDTSKPSISCLNEIPFPSDLSSRTQCGHQLLQEDIVCPSVESVPILGAPIGSECTCLWHSSQGNTIFIYFSGSPFLLDGKISEGKNDLWGLNPHQLPTTSKLTNYQPHLSIVGALLFLLNKTYLWGNRRLWKCLGCNINVIQVP